MSDGKEIVEAADVAVPHKLKGQWCRTETGTWFVLCLLVEGRTVATTIISQADAARFGHRMQEPDCD